MLFHVLLFCINLYAFSCFIVLHKLVCFVFYVIFSLEVMHKHVCASEIKDLQMVFRMFDFVKTHKALGGKAKVSNPIQTLTVI
jgi:hypothetical protein